MKQATSLLSGSVSVRMEEKRGEGDDGGVTSGGGGMMFRLLSVPSIALRTALHRDGIV